MKPSFFRSILVFAVAVSVPFLALAATWPTAEGTAISSALSTTLPPSGRPFEPSDAVWQTRLNRLFLVSDEGDIASMDENGGNLEEWYIGNNDLEGITVADQESNVLYLGRERPRAIMAFDLSTHLVTATYDLSAWIPGTDNLGIEALTFVPDGAHPYAATAMGGVFYAGKQDTGVFYVFDLSGGVVSYLGSINPGYTYISSAHYDRTSGELYALYGSVERELDVKTGALIREYTLPSSTTTQEGFAMIPDTVTALATVFIAEDSGPVYRFDGYPISIPSAAPIVIDADGDGIASDLDCNDSDPTVSSLITYYVDADGDGLGSSISAAFCLSVPPSGYASNANDTNDAIANAGVEIFGDGIDNDGDGLVDEVNTVALNGPHPTFGSYDASNTSAFGSSIIALAGDRDGYILVTYADSSVYQYRAFVATTNRLTSVSSYKGSGYLLVQNGAHKQTAIVNGFTGTIVGVRKNGTSRVMANWEKSMLGF